MSTYPLKSLAGLSAHLFLKAQSRTVVRRRPIILPMDAYDSPASTSFQIFA